MGEGCAHLLRQSPSSPSSAPSKRVFSLVKSMFGDEQLTSLDPGSRDAHLQQACDRLSTARQC
eukprot:4520579-Prymnesium_polylepis.1